MRGGRKVRAVGLALGLGLQACSSAATDLAGNSANTGNAQASGVVRDSRGVPAPAAIVRCRPESFLPWDAVRGEWNSTTDSSGRWTCRDLPGGRIGIEAADPRAATGFWRSWPEDSGASARGDTLAPPGALLVSSLPGTEGTLLLPGTSIAMPFLVPATGLIEIPSVPAGWRGALLVYTGNSGLSPDTLARGLHVPAGGRDSVAFTRTTTRLRLPLGPVRSQDLLDVPLLLRLDSSHLEFSRSPLRGRDLHVRRASGKELPVRVASWDSAAARAELWVRLDTLEAGPDSLDLLVDCGQPMVAGADSSVFTAGASWVGAWGLEETTGTVRDAVQGLDGTPHQVYTAPGVVGRSLHFVGVSGSHVRMAGSASGPLALPVGGPWTYSTWVRLGSLATSRHVMGMGERARFLKFQKSWTTRPVGDTVAKVDSNLWMGKEMSASATDPGGHFVTAAADTGRWTHLALVVRDSVLALYVDGIARDSGSHWDPDADARDPSRDFLLGATLDSSGAVSQPFLGEIDEAWVMSVARPSEWIRLQAWNQRLEAPRARRVR